MYFKIVPSRYVYCLAYVEIIYLILLTKNTPL